MKNMYSVMFICFSLTLLSRCKFTPFTGEPIYSKDIKDSKANNAFINEFKFTQDSVIIKGITCHFVEAWTERYHYYSTVYGTMEYLDGILLIIKLLPTDIVKFKQDDSFRKQYYENLSQLKPIPTVPIGNINTDYGLILIDIDKNIKHIDLRVNEENDTIRFTRMDR